MLPYNFFHLTKCVVIHIVKTLAIWSEPLMAICSKSLFYINVYSLLSDYRIKVHEEILGNFENTFYFVSL